MRKRKRRRLSEKERAEFVKLCVAGVPPRIIGEKFKMSPSAASNLRARLGYAPGASMETLTNAIIKRVCKSVGDSVVRNFPHIVANALQELLLPAAPIETREDFYRSALVAIRAKFARPLATENRWIH